MALVAVLLVAVGCAPAGPPPEELASVNGFGLSMPGATEFQHGLAPARWNIDGGVEAYAVRDLVVGADRAAVLAWHDSALRGLGWVPGAKVTPVNTWGEDEAHSWCAGEFVLGLAFSNREDYLNPPPSTWPGEGTLYELSIVHHVPSSASGWHYCAQPGPEPGIAASYYVGLYLPPLVAATAVIGALLVLTALRRPRRRSGIRSADEPQRPE